MFNVVLASSWPTLSLDVGDGRAGLQHQRDERSPKRVRRDAVGQWRLATRAAELIAA